MMQKSCVWLPWPWRCIWGPRLSSVVMRLGWPCFDLYPLLVRAGWLMGVGPVSLVPGFCTDYDAWRVTARTSGYLAS
jgi:hypothetical protein